jgi:predicted nucleic acid-binding Zn ribbon protein
MILEPVLEEAFVLFIMLVITLIVVSVWVSAHMM